MEPIPSIAEGLMIIFANKSVTGLGMEKK